jgi:hypothetical protein
VKEILTGMGTKFHACCAFRIGVIISFFEHVNHSNDACPNRASMYTCTSFTR